MLQRIQSLYLLLAAIVICLSFFIPVAAYVSDGESFNVYVKYWTLLLWLAIGIASLNLVTIFLYMNRRVQMTLTVLAMFLKLIFFILIVYQVEYISEPFGADNDAAITWGTFIPIVAFAFDLFAIRNISKDEKLVKSMDRLR